MRSTNQRHAPARLCASARPAHLAGPGTGPLTPDLPTTPRRPAVPQRQA